MLHRYRFKNFFSFRDEAEISFVLGDKAPKDGRSVVSTTGQRLSKALAVIGPNASGKTNVIKPLAFLAWFVSDSFRIKLDTKLAVEPHFFSEERQSEFSVDFDWDGVLWRYELKLTSEMVVFEALFRKTSRVFSYVFVREWQGEGQPYRVSQQGFGLKKQEAGKVRKNVSLISWAAQYGVELAVSMASPNIFTNVIFSGRQHLDLEQILAASDFYAHNPQLHDNMAVLLRGWDLGMAAVDIRKVSVTNAKGETEMVWMPFGLHQSGAKTAEIPLFHESSGTQGAFVLLSRLLPALKTGGLAVIDEMEADLHPHMLIPIMDLFFSEETNPHNAQVIFTCHSMEILNQLHKGQVVLVEKDDECNSEAWRLDAMKGISRADDNFYAKYMAGAYGAVPNL